MKPDTKCAAHYHEGLRISSNFDDRIKNCDGWEYYTSAYSLYITKKDNNLLYVWYLNKITNIAKNIYYLKNINKYSNAKDLNHVYYYKGSDDITDKIKTNPVLKDKNLRKILL